MKYLLSFLFLTTLVFSSTNYEILYDQRSTNNNGDYITGFFNIFDPSMDKGDGSTNEYSFEYFVPEADSRFLQPRFSIQTNYRYYKFYIPEGITELSINGVSHYSNTDYEIYISYSPALNFTSPLTYQAGTGANGVGMSLLARDDNPTIKINYNQSSYIADDYTGTPRSGWLYLAIKGIPETGSDPLINTFNLAYRFKVDKTTYNNWLSTVARNGSNPADPNAAAIAPSISTISAPDALATVSYELQLSASGTTPFTWELTNAPTGMTIDQSTGLIQWPSPTQGSHTIDVSVTNSVDTDTASFTLNVDSAPQVPVINPISFSDVEVNTDFSGTVTLSQGTAPITWSLSGQPSGMTINSSGVISWPDASPIDNYNITVMAENNYDGSDIETFTLSVVNPTPPVLDSISDQNYTEGVAYTYNATTSAGSTPMDWNLTNAPDGMTINTSGTISWTNPVIGTYPITIGVSNNGGSDTASYTLNIIPPVAPIIAPISGQTTEAEFFYSYNLELLEGSEPITWNIISPSQTGNYANLSIDNNGRLTWDSPTDGNHTFLIEAVNSANNDVAILSLEVTEPIAPTFDAPIPNFTISSTSPWSYDANASGSGTVEWYGFRFPSGLLIDRYTGLLSWDSPTAGTYNNLRVAVTNTTTGQTDLTDFNITVLAPPAISTIPNQMIPTSLGYEYNATLSNASESGDVNWSLTGDSGAIININSGTITWTSGFAEGNYTINVFANNGLDEGNTTFGLEALPPDYLIINPIADQRIQVGNSLDITATAKGFGAITWSVADANGSGVDINATTGQITLNNAQEGQYAITIRANSTGDGSTGGTDTEDFNLSVTNGGLNPAILMYLLN